LTIWSIAPQSYGGYYTWTTWCVHVCTCNTAYSVMGAGTVLALYWHVGTALASWHCTAYSRQCNAMCSASALHCIGRNRIKDLE